LTTTPQSTAHAIAAARCQAHRRLVRARTAGAELDAAADLLRALHGLLDNDRESVRLGTMSSRAFHARWAGRPCGAGCPACR
jgi:hypothetical protein